MKKFLSLLLAVIMVIGMFPMSAMALELEQVGETEEIVETVEPAEEEQIENEETDVTQEGPVVYSDSENSAITVTIGSAVPMTKLYTWSDGAKGENDLLAEVTAVNGDYTVSLNAGDYLIEGYSADGETFHGSIIITVSETEKSFQVYKVSGIKATNEGWVEGKDYTVSAKVLAKGSMKERQTVVGKEGENASVICLYMDVVTVTFTPDLSLHSDYAENSVEQTIYSSISGVTAEMNKNMNVTVKAPAGSTIQIVNGGTYYGYSIFEPTSVEETADGTTAVFAIPRGNALRIDNPNGVLTWFWDDKDDSFQIRDGEIITITEDKLHFNDAFDIVRAGGMDQADIRLNINEKGHMNMEVGETFEINSTRVFQAVYNYKNTHTGMPNFSYKAIDPATGEESDVVKIVSRDPVTWQADMTALKEGTAIVLVTYDAMYDPATMAGSKLSAIWPENTGVFVVTVGADGSAIETGMKINGELGYTSYKLAGEYIDAEMDVLYYAEGTDGASYSFTPASGSTVTVLHPTVTETAMTYSGGFVTEGVSVDGETGEVTLSKLTQGRHIVKIEKDGAATYQVITAKSVSYTITDANGNAIEEDTIIDAGESITITYTGLKNPAEKQSGVYNFTSRVFMYDDLGNMTYNAKANTMGVYTFNVVKQAITLTVPENWEEETITFNGGIATSAFGGPMGIHRVVDYDIGLGENAYNKEQLGHLCSLPAVTVKVNVSSELIECKLIPMDGEEVLENAEFTVVAENGSKLAVNKDGTFKVTPGIYSYTVSVDGYKYAAGEIEVTAEGEKQFKIEMTKLSEGAWDGKTVTEPSKNKDGWYQISNAAEFVWYASEINYGTLTEYNAILTNDIDLGGYPFTPIRNFAAENTLDGDGHTIKNLYVNLDAAGYIEGRGGLFNSLNGTFKNATVEGEVVYRTAFEGAYVGSITGYISSDYKSTTGGHLINVTSNVNLTVEPAVSGFYAKYGIGGLVGFNANGTSTKAVGTIENCVNNGTITVIDKLGGFNARYVGGIMGTQGNRIDIINCANNGDIIIKAHDSGGIRVSGLVGYCNGNGYWGKLYASYNTGDITVTKPSGATVSGIAGGSRFVEVDGCYNTGDLKLTLTDEKASGTISGLVAGYNYSRVRNSYNIGNIYYTEGVIATNAEGQNCYYLSTSSVTANSGKGITEEEFKTVNLGKYLLATCDGYPEVYWKKANFHTKGEEVGTIAGTCLTNSATVYKCTECEAEFAYSESETGDATNHKTCSHTSIADVEACEFCEHLVVPTCLDKGSIKRICQNEGCGEELVTVANAFGHGWCYHNTLAAVAENPDCTDHHYDEAKCNKIGVIEFNCIRCDEPYPSNYAKPTFYAAHTVDPNTKTEVKGEDYDHYKCADCGATLRVYHTLNTVGDYPWAYDEIDGRWESTVTAPIKGKSEAKIVVDNASMGAIISFDYGCNTGGWRWNLGIGNGTGASSSYNNVDSATYIDEMREMLDSPITFTYNRNNTAETTTGNDFAWVDNVVVHVHVADPNNVNEKNTITSATCTEGGEYYNICSDCGMMTNVKVSTEALGHDIVEHAAQEATCTEIGWDAYETCSRCDYSTYVEKEALGHDMADATCTEPKTCGTCGATEGEALGHSYGNWVTTEEPTETEGGRAVKTCFVCGHKASKYVKPLSEDGITVIVPSEKSEDETNPNTGAPVKGGSALCAIAVLAGMAVVLKKINK